MTRHYDTVYQALSEHVLWGVRMTLGSAAELARRRDHLDLGWPADAALLEAFAIHVRALVEFFWNDKVSPRHDDDGRAVQFFHDPQDWTRDRPTRPDVLTNASQRAGYGVAHISYKRAWDPDEARLWDYAAIALELSKIIVEFADKAPTDRLIPTFRTEVERLENQLLSGLRRAGEVRPVGTPRRYALNELRFRLAESLAEHDADRAGD